MLGVICGIDEAGRGPVLGPLVIVGLMIENENVLRGIGVRDSKRLSPERRKRLAREIKKIGWYEVQIVPASEIDTLRDEFSLNVLEAKVFATIIEKVRAKASAMSYPIEKDFVVYVDAADVNEDVFKNNILRELGFEVELVSKHGADVIYPVVSAASILAKTTRDQEIRKIEMEIGREIGSGYPADPITIKFLKKWLKEYGEPPPHTRRSWETIKKLMREYKTKRLEDFGE